MSVDPLIFTIGALDDVFVGDADGTDVLTHIDATLTEGGDFKYQRPRRRVPAVRGYRTAGMQTVSADVTFYGALSDQVTKLCMGSSINSLLTPDSPGGQAQHILFLKKGEDDVEGSILIPRCEVVGDYDYEMPKGRIPEIKIHFEFFERNRFKRLYYKRSADEIRTILGARSPI